MTPTPTLTPIDVILYPGPAHWWEIVGALGPVAVLTAALLAAIIGWITVRQRTKADELSLRQKDDSDAKALAQKQRADDRAEWWRRAQWALDRALDEDRDTKALGMGALEVLAHSKLAQGEELELFDITWKSVSALSNVSTLGSTDGAESLEFVFAEPRGHDAKARPRFAGGLRPRSSFRRWVSRGPALPVDTGDYERDNGKTSGVKEG